MIGLFILLLKICQYFQLGFPNTPEADGFRISIHFKDLHTDGNVLRMKFTFETHFKNLKVQ